MGDFFAMRIGHAEDIRIKGAYTEISLGAHTITIEDVRSRNLEHMLYHLVAPHLQPLKGRFRETFCPRVSKQGVRSMGDWLGRTIRILLAPCGGILVFIQCSRLLTEACVALIV